MPNVIEICKIPPYIDIPLLKNISSEYLAPRISTYNKMKCNMFIEDKFGEYYIAKASGGLHIGGGHCPMDVKASNGDGIDVMCVSFKGSQTNEKSIMQNFDVSGKDLDSLFSEGKHDEAIRLFMVDLKKKFAKVKADKGLEEFYYISFTSTKTNVYLTAFKIDPTAIDTVESGGFRVGPKGNKNILFKNFIDPAVGTVVLYKSKKRIELRLTRAILKSEHTVKLY
jgi:hypothetical protein